MTSRVALIILMMFVGGLSAQSAVFEKCRGKDRFSCVVDGDTFWLQGVKIRLAGIDASETHTNLCGGGSERQLGERATQRLMGVLSAGRITLETRGVDRYRRWLAKVFVNDIDVGKLLIDEGLART